MVQNGWEGWRYGPPAARIQRRRRVICLLLLMMEGRIVLRSLEQLVRCRVGVDEQTVPDVAASAPGPAAASQQVLLVQDLRLVDHLQGSVCTDAPHVHAMAAAYTSPLSRCRRRSRKGAAS